LVENFEVPIERRRKDFDQKAFLRKEDKGGALIYLSKCGHFVHRDDPAFVISVIKHLINDTGQVLQSNQK